MSTATMARSTLIVATCSAASYGLGLLRDRLLASYFGAGVELDVFNSSFIIPDIITNLFAAAVTTAFIPVFTDVWHKRNQQAGWQATNNVLNSIGISVLILIGLAWLFMPQLSQLVAPGFNQEQHQLLIHTTRLLLLSPLLFGVSLTIGSALQGIDRFVSYAIAPLLYNIGIVGGIILFTPRLGIVGAILGVIVGALLHAGIRLFELWRQGWRWQWYWQPGDIALQHTVTMMLPRVITLLSVQVNLWVYNALGSTLPAGSISVFNLARNFQSLPVSLFGISLATVLFPLLSRHYNQTNHDQFTNQLTQGWRQILFFTLPASVGVMLLAQPLVDTVLGGGKFTAAAVAATSVTLAMFALAIPTESSQHVLARGLYARHDAISPVIVAIISSAINFMVCWLLLPRFQVVALAAGFVVSSVCQVLLLSWRLQRQGVQWLTGTALIDGGKMIAASAGMGLGVWLLLQLPLPAMLLLLAGSSLGALLYLGLSRVLIVPELTSSITMIKKLINRA
ncbi:MAG: murein biosynthesis integral membrane protein MurJ [Candidatus Kerfeldbacteria bacterium]|nr:murein biosynthesis integral membrane protein MurJ [Candidatus Kerfeldbacteria bacterium]